MLSFTYYFSMGLSSKGHESLHVEASINVSATLTIRGLLLLLFSLSMLAFCLESFIFSSASCNYSISFTSLACFFCCFSIFFYSFLAALILCFFPFFSSCFNNFWRARTKRLQVMNTRKKPTTLVSLKWLLSQISSPLLLLSP